MTISASAAKVTIHPTRVIAFWTRKISLPFAVATCDLNHPCIGRECDSSENYRPDDSQLDFVFHGLSVLLF